ncbi:hypothetical protein PHISCL_10887 [Aspergillus sclerotialis]|uniref:Uncharacterized protein n=1 Tax=Aspergillus sclerotialis TaxID=2070753 RepID=A0A3A2Z1L0_9EURO|nr:hypothetical protein PHISCL_10887 [Aspergillus sclerotialis]
MDLQWRKITSDLPHIPNDLLDEGLTLPGLEGDKMAPALVGSLYESIAGHVLYTWDGVRQRKSNAGWATNLHGSRA